MADTYANYADLAAHQVEGVDYRIRQRTPAGSALLHMSPHAGGIEPGAGECADYCAGTTRAFYVFEGIKASGNSVLHLTSTNFDEPRALTAVGKAAYTIAWHGAAGTTAQVFLGGADTALRDRVGAALTAAGFTVTTTPTELDGNDPASINQKNRRAAGVQIEMTLALRTSFFPDGNTGRTTRENPAARTPAFFRFCDTVTAALAPLDPQPDAGNWLDYTTQSTELDTATWVPETNATLARASGGVGTPDQQRHCIAVTAPAAGPCTIRTRYLVPVTPGAAARISAAAHTPRDGMLVTAAARWYAPDSTTLVGASQAAATPPTARWTFTRGDTTTVPTGAAYGRYTVTYTATTAGQTIYLDRVFFGDPGTADDPSPGVPWRRIRLGYPRLGRRRDDISFSTGVNIITAVPVVYSADDFAQVVVATGSGEGRDQYRAVDAVRDGRLRMEDVLELPDIRGNDVLARRARAERLWRQRQGSIESITVRDHPAAPFGSWQVGDDVQVAVHDQWVDFVGWMRITGWRASPSGDDGEQFTISLARADSYTYGAGT